MVILTVKFPKGTKTYDYLMVNKDHVTIDKSKPLKLVTGAGYSGLYTQDIWVVDGRKTDILPSHVTSQLILCKDGIVHSEQIAADVVRRLGVARTVILSTTTKTTNTLPKGEGLFGEVTARQFLEWWNKL